MRLAPRDPSEGWECVQPLHGVCCDLAHPLPPQDLAADWLEMQPQLLQAAQSKQVTKAQYILSGGQSCLCLCGDVRVILESTVFDKIWILFNHALGAAAQSIRLCSLLKPQI